MKKYWPSALLTAAKVVEPKNIFTVLFQIGHIAVKLVCNSDASGNMPYLLFVSKSVTYLAFCFLATWFH
jgi:hypothetical protein